MKLFFTAVSPYARKCLVAAHELGLSERIELLPANPNPIDRDQAIIARNPLGKVPTLLTDEGDALYDSRVICEYLNDLGNGALYPQSGSARWNALSLQSLADGMLDGAVQARYEDAFRPADTRWSAWRAAQLDKSETSLAYLEARPELLSLKRVDIGTLSVACALWYLDLRFADFGWRVRFPGVANWYATFAQRPSLQFNWAS